MFEMVGIPLEKTRENFQWRETESVFGTHLDLLEYNLGLFFHNYIQ